MLRAFVAYHKKLAFVKEIQYNKSMKRSELFFNVAAVPTDAAMLLSAALASFYLRIQPEIVAKIPLSFNLQLHDFLLLT